MRREIAGGIGAHAEKSRMAQRDDPGIAQDEIGREAEEDHRKDLRAEREIVGKGKIGGDGQHPGQRLERAKAVAPREGVDGAAAKGRRHACPKSPRGFHSRITMVRA